jgi:hypothetical protein
MQIKIIDRGNFYTDGKNAYLFWKFSESTYSIASSRQEPNRINGLDLASRQLHTDAIRIRAAAICIETLRVEAIGISISFKRRL